MSQRDELSELIARYAAVDGIHETALPRVVLSPTSRLHCHQKPRRAVSSSGASISNMGLGRVELPTSRLSDGHRALARAVGR